MASSAQVRAWWSAYRCQPSKMVRVSFPGDGRDWKLLVADRSVVVWAAVSQIMATEPYLFRESAGGTYNCRPPSLHAYGLALDLNPSKNPQRYPVQHNYPATFIERMEGIRANGKQALTWGGRWSPQTPPDTMHWQINVAPADCKNVTWDQGGTVEDGQWYWDPENPRPIVGPLDARKVNEYQGWSFWTQADFDYDENDPQHLDERHKVVSARQIDWMMRNGK